MELFMKQTWEDKEKQSLEHEEERKRLEQEAQRNMERLNEERQRRIRMLEEKGDLELIVQELKALQGGERWTTYTSSWPSQISRLLALENRVTAQCRAAVLLRDAVLHDVEHWCEKQRQVQETGGKELDGGAGLRILLQQAERKVGTMLREFESLGKQEQELAGEEKEKDLRDKDKEDGSKEDKTNEVSEEFVQVLGLILRQLDSHRMKIWGQIAEDHKALGGFTAQLQSLADCSSALGADVAELTEEMKLEVEIPGGSGSQRPLPYHSDEVSAALAAPLGLASEELGDANISASSNQQERAPWARSFDSYLERPDDAVDADAYPLPEEEATDMISDEKLMADAEVDLGKAIWVSSFAMQGRRPISGDWEATRPLLAELLDPGDPLPPNRIFKRPPVRLIHDVVVAVHARHQALTAGKSDAETSKDVKKR
eukprot:g32360.t1